ncbi:MAG: tetratricopeptide repeat protein [Thermodesulfobacteriota bacterium]|nr:tetratricopeptide repeat protein [Thermodesulfobacteriota bacterium]
MVNRYFRNVCILLILFILSLLAACGGPEEKKVRFFEKGRAFYEQGNYVKARLEFKNAIQIDLKYAEAYYYLGLTELKERVPQKAFGALSKAVKLDHGLLGAQLELGKLLLGAGDSEHALEKADVVLGNDPENNEALLLKSAALLRFEKIDQAEKLLNSLLEKDNTIPRTYFLLADLYIRRGEREKAVEMLKQGSKADPKEPLFYIILAKIAVQQKKMDEAIELLENVIDLQPGNMDFKLTLAGLKWDLGKKDEATKILNALFDSEPDQDVSPLKVARFYISKKEHGLAEETLIKAIKSHQKSFQLRFQLSRLYINDKKFDKAITVLKQCLTLDSDPAAPGILQAKTELAGIYLTRNELDKATALTDEVLKENPRSVDAHFIRGNLYLLDGDSESAVAEFRISVTERPQFVPGYLRLAQAHFINKEIELGGETLRKGLEANPDSREILQRLIKFYQLKQDVELIETLLTDFLAGHKDDMQVRAVLGDFYASREKIEAARGEYEKIITHVPENPLGYLRMSNLLWKQGKKKETVSLLEKGYGINNNSLPLVSALVQIYLADKQFDKAIALCEKRIVQNKDKAFAYNLLGKVYLERKDFQAAEKSFTKAIELNPEWLAPHSNLAVLYVVKGEPTEAIARFEQALKVNPRQGEIYISLALLYEQTENYEQAMAVYEKALAENFRFWPAANNLAFLLCEYAPDPENLERALQLIQQAREMRPNEPKILDTLGWIYFKMGKSNLAAEIIGQALSAAPKNPVLNYHLGMVLADSGQKEEARKRLQDAVNSGEYFRDIEKAGEALKTLE